MKLEKDKYCVISLINGIENDELTKEGVEWWLSGTRCGGKCWDVG